MRILILKIFVVLFSITLAGLPAHCDPISKEEAEAWVAHVRRINGWADNFDVKAEAEERRLRAEAGLQKNPESRELMRDLGDALHTLGHFAEHEHDFDKALKLHSESLRLFQRSGLETRESWDDGTVHAKEHVFMDYFDEGVRREQKGDLQGAGSAFDKAYEWTEENQLIQSSANRSERFLPRYYNLLKRRQIQFKELSVTAGKVLGAMCRVIMSPVIEYVIYRRSSM